MGTGGSKDNLNKLVRSEVRPKTAHNFSKLSQSVATGNKYSRVLKHSYSRADDLSKNSRLKQS